MTRRVVTTAHLAVTLGAWLVAAGPAAAQTPAPDLPITPSSAVVAEQAGHGAGGQEPVASEYPSLHISGFADVNVTAQPKAEGVRGFSLGQFVLHMASALSPRVNVF